MLRMDLVTRSFIVYNEKTGAGPLFLKKQKNVILTDFDQNSGISAKQSDHKEPDPKKKKQWFGSVSDPLASRVKDSLKETRIWGKDSRLWGRGPTSSSDWNICGVRSKKPWSAPCRCCGGGCCCCEETKGNDSRKELKHSRLYLALRVFYIHKLTSWKPKRRHGTQGFGKGKMDLPETLSFTHDALSKRI